MISSISSSECLSLTLWDVEVAGEEEILCRQESVIGELALRRGLKLDFQPIEEFIEKVLDRQARRMELLLRGSSSIKTC